MHPLLTARGRTVRRRVATLAWWGFLVGFSIRPAAGQSPLERGREHHRRGELSQAVEAYRQALRQPAPTGDHAAASNNLCMILGSQGENSEALSFCRQAVSLRRAQGGMPGAPLSRALNNLALVLQHVGEYGEAETLLNEALVLNRGLGEVGAQVVNLSNLGTLCLEVGDFSRAMDLFQQSEDLATRASGTTWSKPQRAVARFNQAVILEAIGAYRESLALLEEVAAVGELPREFEASFETTLGVVLRNLGDPVRAVREFEDALRYYEAQEDLSGQANAWLNLGIAQHLNLADVEAAENSYQRSLSLARESKDRAGETLALYYLGTLRLEARESDAAKAFFRECLHLAQESGISEGEWSAYEGLGRCSALEGDLERAAELQERAIEILEEQRSRIHRRELRTGYFGDRRSPYAAAVQVYARMEKRSPARGAALRALELVQRAKSRELLETLGSARSQARPMTAQEIVEAVGRGRLLELFFAEDRLFGWWVESGRVELLDLGPSEEVLAAAAEVHRRLATDRELAAGPLELLSRTLLSSLPLHGLAGRELWLAPDRDLHYLPFELLPLPKAAESAPVRLVQRAAVAYLPSASSLAWLQQRQPTNAPILFTGFALPEGPPGPPPQGLSASILLEAGDFEPLPASEYELTASARQIGEPHRLRIGMEATEDAFIEAATRGSRILHLATHTVVREGGGSSAGVLLAPSDGDDGFLSPEEIAVMEAEVDLTVLASCRTALGTGDGAEALSSLSGSLLAAGSRSVVATLWDVGDEATAVFMEQFYYQLRRGLPPAVALREAKLRLMAEPGWSNPTLWAGYVLIGDPPAILPPTGLRRWWRWVLVLVGLGISGGSLAFRRGRGMRRQR